MSLGSWEPGSPPLPQQWGLAREPQISAQLIPCLSFPSKPSRKHCGLEKYKDLWDLKRPVCKTVFVVTRLPVTKDKVYRKRCASAAPCSG